MSTTNKNDDKKALRHKGEAGLKSQYTDQIIAAATQGK